MPDYSQTVSRIGDVRIIRVKGHLDAHTAPQLEDVLTQMTEEAAFRAVLDLGDLTYISSAGLGVLTGTLGTFREQGGDLKLSNTPDKAYRVLDLLGFTRLFTLHDTTEEAVASFHLETPSRQ